MGFLYLDLAHLSLPLFLFWLSDTAFFFFHFDCRCTLRSLLEDERHILTDIWLIAAREGFLVEKRAAVHGQILASVIKNKILGLKAVNR